MGKITRDSAYQAMNPEVLKDLRDATAHTAPLGGKEQASRGMEASPPRKVIGTPFKKGKSGNPKGRPHGSKNKTTLVKEAVLAEGTNIILRGAPAVIQAVMDQAIGGCLNSQRLIWNSLIPSQKAQEGAASKGPQSVNITIEGIPAKREVVIDAEIVDESTQ